MSQSNSNRIEIGAVATLGQRCVGADCPHGRRIFTGGIDREWLHTDRTPCELANGAPHYVSYLHGRGYRIGRNFPSLARAWEFIDNNALVYPLPGARIELDMRDQPGWPGQQQLALDFGGEL